MKIDLTFWLIMALTTSIVGNAIAFYYIRVVLAKLFYVGDNLSDLADMVTNYRNHLKSVYQMEMFYGDETLQHLVEHTRSLHLVLEEFEDVYEITEPPEDDEQIEQEEQINAETTINQENVFYGGTRASDN